jgi:hypothetical protein
MKAKFSSNEVIRVIVKDPEALECYQREGVITGLAEDKATHEIVYAVDFDDLEDGYVFAEFEIASTGRYASPQPEPENARIVVRTDPETGSGEVIKDLEDNDYS